MRIVGVINVIALLTLSIMGNGNAQIISQPAEDEYHIAVFNAHEARLQVAGAYALSWALTELAANAAGLNIQPLDATWAGAMTRLKNHRIDMVFGAFKTPEREQWAFFSLPLGSEGSSIFTLPGNPVNAIHDIQLEVQRVGVSLDSYQHQQAIDVGFKQIYPIRERDLLFNMLQGGRIDYIIYADTMVSLFCTQHNITRQGCLKRVGDPLSRNQLHVIAHQDNVRGKNAVQRLSGGLQLVARKQDLWPLFVANGYDRAAFYRWMTLVSPQVSPG